MVIIDLQGVPTRSGTLIDSYLYLYNSQGQLLTQDDDGGLNSELVYVPDISGTYYLTAGAFADSSAGTYALGVHREHETTNFPDGSRIEQYWDVHYEYNWSYYAIKLRHPGEIDGADPHLRR